MVKISQNIITVVAIPNWGLGDVLYHLLFLKFMQRIYKNIKIAIFAPKTARELIRSFNVQPHNVY